MITKPKGTYDVLPDEVKAWTKLESIIRRICQIYNYKEIRTPIFESSRVFHRDASDTSDMVTKETYDFLDRSNRQITLRPEGTAGVVRAFIENKLYAQSPMQKLFYLGQMFRYERPQKGRNRQFNQFGVEALGSADPLIDAEVIALGTTLIKGLGLKNVKVKINSIGDKESREAYKKACVAYFSQYKDELCGDCLTRLEKNPLRILDCKVDRHKEFFLKAPKIKDYLNESSLSHFETVLKALDEMKIVYEIEDNLVRGLDYYSHTVFELEVDIPEFGAQNVIGAGGRYDTLVSDMEGPDIPGVGMAFGMERLLLAAEFANKSLGKPDYLHVYFIALGEAAKKACLTQMNICRLGGLYCDMDYLSRGLKAQFKTADQNHAMFTCILGDNELEEFKINIKNNETEEQETISIYDVYPYVLNKINAKSACAGCKEKRGKRMKRVMLKNIELGKENKVAGFVENIRNKKTMCFIVLKDVSGKLQLTIEKEKHPELIETLDQITVDSVIEAQGLIVESEYVKLNHMEMYPDTIVVHSIAAPSPIVAPKGEETNIDLRLDYRWIDLRTDKNTLMFQVQSHFVSKCREFLLKRDFIEIHSPKLIGAESETGAGVFKVEYFDGNAYLAQSPQFYKQMAMAAGFERIFESGPVFRAEKFASRKHATEFTGFDLEFSYIESFHDVMHMEEEMLTYALKAVAETYGDKIKEVYGLDVIVPTLPFPVMDLKEVYAELEKRYGYQVPESEKGDLTTEGERLCQRLSLDKFGHEFLFVTGYHKENRAFYHMRDEHDVPCGYDLIWKGCEITTGAQREHRYEILKKQALEKGLEKDVEFYLDFFKYGCPPHGGFGIGVDRITMLIFEEGIKDAMFIFRGPDRLNP